MVRGEIFQLKPVEMGEKALRERGEMMAFGGCGWWGFGVVGSYNTVSDILLRIIYKTVELGLQTAIVDVLEHCDSLHVHARGRHGITIFIHPL